MILRHKFGSWRVTFAVVKVEETVGLNSLLPDKTHILMWDIDNNDYYEVVTELRSLMERYSLPPIYIFQSSPGHYHAYCLYCCSWLTAIHIISHLPSVDQQWLRGAVTRGYFTLRIGYKYKVVEPTPLQVIPSNIPETAYLDDLINYDRYETVDRSPRTR